MTDNYRISASDNQGHSARHWFRTIPQMARQVEQVVAGKKFPYRTKGDLLRHALHRHIQWLVSQGAITSVTGQVDAILEIMRDEEMNSDFIMVFDKMNERINGHLGAGATGEAVRLIRLVQDYVKVMPEGHWRERYTREIEMKFGHLVSGQDKAKLGNVE